jgi:hypothetical protein
MEENSFPYALKLHLHNAMSTTFRQRRSVRVEKNFVTRVEDRGTHRALFTTLGVKGWGLDEEGKRVGHWGSLGRDWHGLPFSH